MGLVLARGLDAYSQTGRLPETPVWTALARRAGLDPGRFDAAHPILAGLFQPSTTPGLMPVTPYWDNLRVRYEANAGRFVHYHPFLGRLVERDARVREALASANAPGGPGDDTGPAGGGGAGSGGTNPATLPGLPGDSAGGGGPGGGSTGTGVHVGGGPGVRSVPEPPGAMLATLGIAFVLGLLMARFVGGMRPARA